MATSRSKSQGPWSWGQVWPMLVAVLAVIVLATVGMSSSNKDAGEAEAATDWTYTALWNETYNWPVLTGRATAITPKVDKIMYVSDMTNPQLGGSDDPTIGNGTKEKPYRTLKNALSKVGEAQRPIVTSKHVAIMVRGNPKIDSDFKIAPSIISLQIIGTDLSWGMGPKVCNISVVNTVDSKVPPYFRMTGFSFVRTDFYTPGGVLTQIDKSRFVGAAIDPRSYFNFYNNYVEGLKIYNTNGVWPMSFRGNVFADEYSTLNDLFAFTTRQGFPNQIKFIKNDFGGNSVSWPQTGLTNKILFDSNY